MGEWKKVPLNGEPYPGVEDAELDGVSPLLIDGFVNELDHTIKRPCLGSFIDTGTSAGIDGAYWWDKQQVAMIVTGGRVFKMTDFTGTVTELTGATLSIGTKVTFATDGTKLLMANGGQMVHTTVAGPLTVMADPQAPTAVTHVAYIDGFALANEVATGRVHIADLNDLTSWSGDLFTAEGKPDDVVAVHEGWNEIAVVGRESVEIWVNDGQNPFSRLQGGNIQRGCSAPYTFAQVGDAWMWLDEKRRFVQLTGRTPTEVGFPYSNILEGFNSVDDAVGHGIKIAGQDFYMVSFPLAGRTLVYNVNKKSWHEWGYWNTSTGTYGQFRGKAYCYAKNWNLHLVGDHSNGKVYTLSRSIYQDDGSPCRTLRRSGFISHGTGVRKRSKKLRARLKRGQGTPTLGEPFMRLRFRNDGGEWGNWHNGSLGAVGDHGLYVHWKRLGMYRARQYEIESSANCDFVFVEMEEDIDLLAN